MEPGKQNARNSFFLNFPCFAHVQLDIFKSEGEMCFGLHHYPRRKWLTVSLNILNVQIVPSVDLFSSFNSMGIFQVDNTRIHQAQTGKDWVQGAPQITTRA